MKQQFTIVTGNEHKWAEIQAILGTDHFSIQRAAIDLPELQGSIEEIAKEKCRMAAVRLGTAVLTEDTALVFDALGPGCLPGPYIKWFLASLGHAGLNRMLGGWEDKGARAICTFAYSEGPDCEPILFQGITQGRIVPARGPLDFGWDPIFQPDHPSGQTYAEMDKAVKNAISHRGKALTLLKQHFSQ